MENNYLTNKASLLYKIFKSKLKKAYKKLEKYCVKCFLNTSLLRDLYASEFVFDCACSYCKSQIDFVPNYKIKDNKEIKVSYLGNLGLNRYKALIEIGQILNQIDEKIKLHIYGKIKDLSILEELNASLGVKYKGFVPYKEVVQIIHSSDLLIHTEYSSVENNQYLKYAFSTKIADSICSGTPLFVYADENLAFSKFLIDNGCSFFESDKEKLKESLQIALFDEEARQKVLECSKNISGKYFKNNSEVEEFIRTL